MMIHSHNQYGDLSDKMQRCHSYIHALEQERRKVLAFQRELPLCLEIVTQAIEACRQQLPGTTTTQYNQSESSEQTSHLPVLEEFIPIKKASSSESYDDECKNPSNISHKEEGNCINLKKSDWLRSVRLWNQTPDPANIQEDSSKTIDVKDVSRTGAFHPFAKDKVNLNIQPSPPASTNGGVHENKNNDEKEKEVKSPKRKTRRCWSPELHKRFLQALKQLGGSHATPKQIRELMKVDGLTNDEVKSHLQKYRLHTRRPSSSVSNATTNPPQQFLVVGGIWVPPEYSLVAKSGESSSFARTNNNGIYAPIASLPKELSKSAKQQTPPHCNDRNNMRGCSHSDSPATSSPTHTTNSY